MNFQLRRGQERDRKSTRLNSSHPSISYAVFCLKKQNVAAVDVDECARGHATDCGGVRRSGCGQPAAVRALGDLQHPGHGHLAVFFFNDTATPEIYTLSLHDALPI